MNNSIYDAKTLWTMVLPLIEPKLSLTFFDVWIRNLTPIQITDDRLYLLANLESTKKTVCSKYLDLILECAKYYNPYINQIVIFCENDDDSIIDIKNVQTAVISSEKMPNSPYNMMFDEQYTFDNFVVGGSNDIACAAAKAVANNPGKSYNPLFIYGGVGLGKTHIIHAVGNYILNRAPQTKILYVTTANFTNDYIESLKGSGDNAAKFRDKYRSVDVLMLDDIQFISGKVATQEALFHAFNDLYQSKKQIIFTSDRHPKELNELEDRLRSRFQSGLTVDISYPDIETRIAILQRKVMTRKYEVSQAIITYIAEKINTNIRELEGALSKVMFYCTLNNIPAQDIGVATLALKDELENTACPITMEFIVGHVCNYFSIDKKDMVGKKKTKQLVEARHIAIYLITEYISAPLTTIGEFFGGRDYSTIIHARDKITELYQSDSIIKTAVNDLTDLIKA